MFDSLEKFSKIGFLYQEPTKDKTYFFTRHTESTSEQLWVQLKKTPEVEYRVNYKSATMPKPIEALVEEFLGELDFETYRVV